jgi:hypothetical protein
MQAADNALPSRVEAFCGRDRLRTIDRSALGKGEGGTEARGDPRQAWSPKQAMATCGPPR